MIDRTALDREKARRAAEQPAADDGLSSYDRARLAKLEGRRQIYLLSDAEQAELAEIYAVRNAAAAARREAAAAQARADDLARSNDRRAEKAARAAEVDAQAPIRIEKLADLGRPF